MWVKLPLCLGWNRLPGDSRGMWGGWDIKICFPPNSMGSQQVPHEPALQLSMDPSPRGFATEKKIWMKLRCGQECTRWIWEKESPKTSPKMKILAAMDFGKWESVPPLGPCCPSPPCTLLACPCDLPHPSCSWTSTGWACSLCCVLSCPPGGWVPTIP